MSPERTLGGASKWGIQENLILGRHDGGESGWYRAQSVPGFLGSRRPGSTVVALLTDSAMRGFAISFFTSRRTASLNALFLFLRGITPSSCHAPKAKNGQFRPDEEILEIWRCILARIMVGLALGNPLKNRSALIRAEKC